jgi:acyl dehydratase
MSAEPTTDGPTVLRGVDAVRRAAGTTLGTSPWVVVDQDRIDGFADATGDHQWIHVDPERAARESAFGGTIAHGYLTLSLINFLLPQVVEVTDVSMGINYGLDRVRFPAPVPSGSRLRAHVELGEVAEVSGGVQTTMAVTVECDQTERPACVATVLSRFLT